MNIRYPIYKGVYRILTIKQSFNISRLQYGNKESYMAGLIESNK